MMKKIFALLLAGLMLTTLTLTACNDGKDKGKDTDDTEDPGIIEEYETDEEGNIITTEPEETTGKEEPGNQSGNDSNTDISESKPEIKDSTVKKIYVFAAQATIRSNTVVEEDSYESTAKKGDILDVTGETTNWYQISYKDKTCYIAKTVAGDNAVLEGFTAVTEKTVTVTTNAKLRSYPTTAFNESKNDRTYVETVKAGATLTLVATSADGKWSRVKCNIEGIAAGEYYISSDCIQ
jgi:predicted small secreted protein